MNKKSGHNAASPLNGAVLSTHPGRPKGAKNKLSRAAKENIAEVFEDVGGPQGMADWVQASPRNRETFYRDIYPKILALDVKHSGEVSGVLTFMFGENGNSKDHE